MTHKHTPGPWVHENYRVKHLISGTGAGWITRDVCRLDSSTMAAFEQEANAKLIAAAPDLLAALEACLQVLRANGDNFGRRAQLAADTAITKATK